MADVVDAATRSKNMAAIRGKDTKPEIELRRKLHAMGFRFRLHDKRLPGKPDIVLRRYGAVIFVHGCFWHRHDACRYATTPATRAGFWQTKFDDNRNRDLIVRANLRAAGWRIGIIWECALKRGRAEETAALTASWLRSEEKEFETQPIGKL